MINQKKYKYWNNQYYKTYIFIRIKIIRGFYKNRTLGYNK